MLQLLAILEVNNVFISISNQTLLFFLIISIFRPSLAEWRYNLLFLNQISYGLCKVCYHQKILFGKNLALFNMDRITASSFISYLVV